MANTLLHDDIVALVEPVEGPEDSVKALLLGIANRIDTHGGGNGGQLKEYAKSLRESPDEVTSAVLANKADDSKEGKYDNG